MKPFDLLVLLLNDRAQFVHIAGDIGVVLSDYARGVIFGGLITLRPTLLQMLDLALQILKMLHFLEEKTISKSASCGGELSVLFIVSTALVISNEHPLRAGNSSV